MAGENVGIHRDDETADEHIKRAMQMISSIINAVVAWKGVAQTKVQTPYHEEASDDWPGWVPGAAADSSTSAPPEANSHENPNTSGSVVL